MTPLALLHALHEHPTLTFHRVGEGVKVLPRTPEEARPVLAHFKPALLRTLEEGERLEAAALLRDPHRLAALLAHALEGEAPVWLTLYGKGEEPRRYLAPRENLTPHLAWASRHLPAPRRMHLALATGGGAVDWREGWEVALEARVAGMRYLLLPPAVEAWDWVEAAGKGLAFPEEVRVWKPGKPPATATGWKEAQSALEALVEAIFF
ncbi:hypothetical protein ACQE8T_28335 [Klebsiella pneumoniae]